MTAVWDQFYRISALSLFCLLLSCPIGLWHWRRLPRAIQTLVLYLVFNFVIEIAARFAAALFHQNLPLLHLYTLGEFLLFSLFYRQILDEQSPFRKFSRGIIFTGSVLILLNTLFVQNILEFNSYAKTLVQVMIILYAFDFAFRLPEREEPGEAWMKALHRINTGVLIYYCGSLFIFMTSQFESQAREAFKILWTVNKYLNFVFQLLILFALWILIFRPSKSSSSQVRAF